MKVLSNRYIGKPKVTYSARVVERFLWRPLELHPEGYGIRRQRWLSREKVVQCYLGDEMWLDVAWADDETTAEIDRKVAAELWAKIAEGERVFQAYQNELSMKMAEAARKALEEEITCDYCGDGGGEERGPDYYVPCPMCGDGKGSQWGSGDPLYGNDGREW